MSEQTVPVLNIIGPVGIGKTSVAYAVSDILQYDYEQAIPHALVDLDEIRRAWPAPADDLFNMALGFKNLAAVWSNYAKSGARCVIIPNVMEDQEDLGKLRTAIPGAEVFVVRLSASLAANHQRIREREKTPEGLEWHLNRATQLHQELPNKKLENLIINTDGKSPKEIAHEIVEHWGVTHKFLSPNR